MQGQKLYSSSLIVQLVKNLPAMQETWVQFLGGEHPLEKEMATHSSFLAWVGKAIVHGVTRVRHDLATKPPPPPPLTPKPMTRALPISPSVVPLSLSVITNMASVASHVRWHHPPWTTFFPCLQDNSFSWLLATSLATLLQETTFLADPCLILKRLKTVPRGLPWRSSG